MDTLERVRIYANSHHVTPRPTLNQAVKNIKIELKETLERMEKDGMLLEAQRLEQRVNFDIEMMETTGSCAGIENYSRYLTGRKPGEPPPTLVRIHPRQRHCVCRRKPRVRAAAWRNVQRRLSAQVHAGRAWLSLAVLHGQPPA